ncbi:MAG: two-component system response regulator [Myxococcota bacterium]
MTFTPSAELTAEQRSTILAVDDAPENLNLLYAVLKDEFRVRLATSGHKALEMLQRQPPPDLILLDVMMPMLDGYQVCRQIKGSPQTAEIPVIFLTARAEDEDEAEGFAAGAVDYITKPLSPPLLLARVRTHLELKAARDKLREQNQTLQSRVRERTRQIEQLQDVTIRVMASLAETRDNETGNHIKRTQKYVFMLATYLQQHTPLRDELTDDVIELLYKSAPLHDVGKIGIPDAILLKPGKLTAEEFEIMKLHTVYGRDVIAHAEQQLGEPNSFLRFAREIAYSHQEKYDGTGYPEGLRAAQIPLSARIMAVADVYDALTTRRPYKEPFTHEDSCRMIISGSGQHFDPVVVQAFVALKEQFLRVSRELAD